MSAPSPSVRLTNLLVDKGPSFDMVVSMTDTSVIRIPSGHSAVIPISGANTIIGIVTGPSSGAPVSQHTDIG
jgi:acyl-homoserine lactone acylase PvdQ